MKKNVEELSKGPESTNAYIQIVKYCGFPFQNNAQGDSALHGQPSNWGYLIDPSLAQDLECGTQDRDTFLLLKDKLGNPASLSPWNSTSDCCSSGWHGICCKAGRVSSLQLMSLTDINGTIPPEIGRLP